MGAKVIAELLAWASVAVTPLRVPASPTRMPAPTEGGDATVHDSAAGSNPAGSDRVAVREATWIVVTPDVAVVGADPTGERTWPEPVTASSPPLPKGGSEPS